MTTPLMKAIGVYRSSPITDSDSLVDVQCPVPTMGDFDLLVRVEAVSVNPADCRVRRNKANDGHFRVLGWDVAGIVVDVGPHVSPEFSKGDAVYYAGDINRPGANSEYHVVDARIVGHRPANLSAAESAALPLTALTAYEALFERMRFSRTENARPQDLLIVGGAGGAGSMAIQLAKLVPQLRVIATASSAPSRAWCQDLGADAVINHFDDMKQQLAAKDIHSVDAALLLNDADRHFPALAEIVAPQGTICSVVPFTAPPDMNLLMRKSISFTWEFMFTRPMFGTADLGTQRQILNEVSHLVDTGRLVTTWRQTLGPINAQNLRHAHAQLEHGHTIGKLVLAGF